MIRKFLIIVVLSSFSHIGNAQTEKPCDSCQVTFLKHVEQLTKQVEEQNKALEEKDSLITSNKELIDSLRTVPNYNFFYQEHAETQFSDISIWFIIIPLLFLLAFLSWTNKAAGGFDLKKALSELKIIEVHVANPAGGYDLVKQKESIESSSRLIAFLSGIVALVLSFTLILISIYIYLNSGIMPNFSQLVNAVIALGIGVLPYSINKVTGIFK